MKATNKTFPYLGCGASVPDEVTVVDVLRARNRTAHEARVQRWAQSAWDAWAPYHGTIRRWRTWFDG